jgi:1,4-dihydroxy-2-naphthoyl-CoA hydrolase
MKKQKAVGLEINANHIRPVRSGIVTGITKAVALGKSVHVWNIEIFNEAGKMNCVSRLTTAVVNLKEDEKEKNIRLVDSLLSS